MYNRFFALFFWESPQIGHREFQRLGLTCLNRSRRGEINPTYFWSVYKLILYYNTKFQFVKFISQGKYDISSEDNSVRSAGIEFLKQIAEAVGELGGGPVGGILYGSWPSTLPAGMTDKRPFVDRSVLSMREAIKAAENNNVTFNMEVVNRFEQFIMNSRFRLGRHLSWLPNKKRYYNTTGD